MESTFRLITFSRSHLADDLLNAYIDQTSNFRELLSIKNAQMEAQNEEEAIKYTKLLRKTSEFISHEVKNSVDFTSEIQLFQLFRLISPDSHSSHPNRYRHQIVQIGKYLCPLPEMVPGLVKELFYRISEIKDPIIRAIYFHHEMIRIHPFSDGNGRTIRMAKNWMLMYQLYPSIFISDSDEKKQYINTLAKSFEWLHNKECKWNQNLDDFFNQELERLIRNSDTIYETVLKAGNKRE
ncbi:Fic family protein [Sediminibacter sp. Hel_I_10]|uniref:Fic family protein n=1 Tax=Sediminibacter sp. Hel_I_10 TaxID=1392490 RepID=UPI0018CC140C|nr:Fic family protein [Sediminibacter sp. Hel_I_10]